MWYEFDSLDDFNAWHDALCDLLGYPLASYNQLTGQIDPDSTPTTAYCEPSPVDSKYIVFVEDQYADGLTQTDLRIVKPILE